MSEFGKKAMGEINERPSTSSAPTTPGGPKTAPLNSELNHLANDMFSKVSDYLKGQLEGSHHCFILILVQHFHQLRFINICQKSWNIFSINRVLLVFEVQWTSTSCWRKWTRRRRKDMPTWKRSQTMSAKDSKLSTTNVLFLSFQSFTQFFLYRTRLYRKAHVHTGAGLQGVWVAEKKLQFPVAQPVRYDGMMSWVWR